MGGRTISALGAAALLALAAAPAQAKPLAGSPLDALSGGTPFPGACGNSERPQPGAEAETHLAADPSDPRRLVAAWQQDRFRSAGALSTGAAVSANGGRSWRRVEVPGTTTCVPAGFDRASDPWLSFGADGTAYLATLQINTEGVDTHSRIVVNRSTDGGATWSQPVFAVDRGQFEDKEALTADPTRPGTAYLVWGGESGGNVTTGWFSRSTDGGATWTAPRLIYTAPPGVFANGHVVVVTPSGTLVDVFYEQTASGGGEAGLVQVMAMRSDDQGDTWSEPVVVGPAVPGRLADEEGNAIRTGESLPSAAAGPDGSVYAAWRGGVPGAGTATVVARSGDGGRSFGPPRRVNRVGSPAFTPVVAAGRRGVAVTYGDFRFDRGGDRELTASWWIAHSHDRGRTWSESRLGGPFDMRRAPRTSAGKELFLGDYSGLVPLANGFAATLVEAPPAATRGRSDVFFTRAALGHRPRPLRIALTLARRGNRVRVRAVGVVDGRRRPLAAAAVRAGRRRAQTNSRGRATVQASRGTPIVVRKPGFPRAVKRG